MKAVSLFAGVGGFDLALRNNGVDVVASVEIDKHARKILEKQFPNTTHLEDVKEVTGEQLFKLGFDSSGIIVGGFPCQDLSVAGKRAGLSGKRSGLFYEVARILQETQAQYFILENVPGLLSSNKGADMGAVLGTLDDLGYSVAWRVLDAQYFGVPQRRKRVFIVGYLGNDWRISAEILNIAEGRSGYLAQGGKSTKEFTTKITESVGVYSESSFGQYKEVNAAGTLRASGGYLGGGSESLLIM
jgi:DNA (cytosine-5)-methyltransferase 1